MDFKLTEEQQLLVESIRQMGEKEGFKELATEVDKTCEFPWQLLPLYAEMDLLGMTLSRSWRNSVL
jgi:alkylation response protein AidB-like acyl-CoA dehydrogenase